jgi:hypothetical protein
LTLTVIHAEEVGTSRNRKKISWSWSPICRFALAGRLSKSANGTRCDGRSRSSTKS